MKVYQTAFVVILVLGFVLWALSDINPNTAVRNIVGFIIVIPVGFAATYLAYYIGHKLRLF